jgi:2-iminobutanoate/2-iminopropanoate deaminase
VAKRQNVRVPSIPGHRNPIPVCVTLGNLILPSVISGADPAKDEPSADPAEQIAQAFINMKNIVEAAGGTTDNIGKITVYLKNFQHRELVNKEWLKMFPDENNRPARHTMQLDMPGKVIIQMDIIAAL